MFKKIKFCFRTSDYEGQDRRGKTFIILDIERKYYGVQFIKESKEVKYGLVTNPYTGTEYNTKYTDNVFVEFIIYYNTIFFKPIKNKYKRIIDV
jgi:hypothetical protein